MNITSNQAANLLLNLAAKRYQGFFQVLFKKKDGSLRWMNCRLNVRAYLKGGVASYNFLEKRCLNVCDVALIASYRKREIKSPYRNIKIDEVLEIKVDHQHFIVDRSLQHA